MTTPRTRIPLARAAGRGLLAAAMLAAGCTRHTPSLELTGPDMRDRLPPEVAGALTAEAVLCLDEEGAEGAYRLWLLRCPEASWLQFPEAPAGLERHALPSSALEGLWRARLSGVPLGPVREPRGRFSHWRGRDGSEVQLREILTDHGWFASLERVRT